MKVSIDKAVGFFIFWIETLLVSVICSNMLDDLYSPRSIFINTFRTFILMSMIRGVLYLIPYVVIHIIMIKFLQWNLLMNSTLHVVLFIVLSLLTVWLIDPNLRMMNKIGWVSVILTIPTAFLSAYLSYKVIKKRFDV